MSYHVHWFKLVSGEEIMCHVISSNTKEATVTVENPIKITLQVRDDNSQRLMYAPFCFMSRSNIHEISMYSIIASTQVSEEFESDYIDYLMSVEQSSSEDLIEPEDDINNELEEDEILFH